MIRLSRVPFLILAMLGLLLGLWTGLSRIGWNLDLLIVSMHHGAIMVGGFLGTLISLEKIIPLKKRPLFVIPLFSALSVVMFFVNLAPASFALLVAAAVALTLVFVHYLVKEKNIIYLLMAGGAICWLVGNVLLMVQNFYPLAFPWWLAFALLIITAERLELMKFLPVSMGMKLLLVFLLLTYVCGVLMSFHGTGRQVSGIALIAISIWLMQFDIVGISLRKRALPRFVAVALLAGYVAMLFTGIFFLTLNNQAMAYDAIVHTFFLGFAFSMIFAHGPIILPGVLGISAKPYHPLLYGWLILLHTSWITRIAGDIFLQFEMRKISGLISAIAILGYFATVATLTIMIQRRHAKTL